MFKTLAKGPAAAVIGNMVAEKFILKSGPDDPSGFIEVADGLGMDDLARGLTIAVAFLLINQFVG